MDPEKSYLGGYVGVCYGWFEEGGVYGLRYHRHGFEHFGRGRAFGYRETVRDLIMDM